MFEARLINQKLKDALAGTEDELSRLRALIEQLNAEGENKNKELEQLQKLLEQLQEQAAMRDFVLRNLDEKADKADFERLLSRDDLDETAQAIIAQLQDLIAKQGLNLIRFNCFYPFISSIGGRFDEQNSYGR